MIVWWAERKIFRTDFTCHFSWQNYFSFWLQHSWGRTAGLREAQGLPFHLKKKKVKNVLNNKLNDLIWNNFYVFLPRNLIEIMKTENECHALSEFFCIFRQSLHTSCLLHSFERLILVHRSLLTGFEECRQGFNL